MPFNFPNYNPNEPGLGKKLGHNFYKVTKKTTLEAMLTEMLKKNLAITRFLSKNIPIWYIWWIMDYTCNFGNEFNGLKINKIMRNITLADKIVVNG
ncbi:MAG: hypothetical protein LBF22_15215 [Deltaproteobacteria bacterium]|jgi:hypothetical protein|nr:hypothetical protein [Deltaproteobacteria bacterium]